MQNSDFDQHELDRMGMDYEGGDEGTWDQEQLVMLAAGLSVLFAAIAGVLVLLARRRRPTRLQRAEAALANAATRAEQAARTVRKQGPGMLERGARRTEELARTVRKQGPSVVVKSGERVEQFGRAIR
ncbi:MAG TPA: hypothetical protein VFX76_03095, partial [Roseiflexaceae bacterium]|nr:hypothetical protein [Roseiflexaceae bacterium]